jgi:hypothetical protein
MKADGEEIGQGIDFTAKTQRAQSRKIASGPTADNSPSLVGREMAGVMEPDHLRRVFYDGLFAGNGMGPGK